MRPHPFLLAPCLAVVLTGCAITPRSDGLTTAEAVRAKRIELRLSNASNRIRNDALDAYLARCLATLDPDPAVPIALYVIDNPTPQADLLANRILRLRLSLLLALRSDDELLFVLAHELAHRDLAHLSARRTAEWDPASAEREADLGAVATLRKLGKRESAGLTLLRRLAANAGDDAYRRALEARVEALGLIVADGDTTSPGNWPLDAILDRYRDRAAR